MSLRQICLVIMIGVVGVSWGQDVTVPPEWGFQTYIGSDIELECNDTDAMVEADDMLMWHSPGGHEILNDHKYVLRDSNNVGSMYLTIKAVTDHDKGVYLCKIYRNNMFRVKINRGVNIYEPLYKDNFYRYRYNTMVGGIAAAVLFVPLVFICFLYKCRYKSDEYREKTRRDNVIRKNRFLSNSDYEAGELPSKYQPENGVDAGYVNEGYANTHL